MPSLSWTASQMHIAMLWRAACLAALAAAASALPAPQAVVLFGENGALLRKTAEPLLLGDDPDRFVFLAGAGAAAPLAGRANAAGLHASLEEAVADAVVTLPFEGATVVLVDTDVLAVETEALEALSQHIQPCYLEVSAEFDSSTQHTTHCHCSPRRLLHCSSPSMSRLCTGHTSR